MLRESFAAAAVLTVSMAASPAPAQTLQSLEAQVLGTQSADQTQTQEQTQTQQVTSGCSQVSGFVPRGLSTSDILQPSGFSAGQTAVNMQGDIQGKAGPRC